MPDVFKIFKDLELKAVGLDPNTGKMQEGYFSSFRSIGLPIHKDDYWNPWTPLGGNLAKDLPKTEPVDPKAAAEPATGSSKIDPNQAYIAGIARAQQSYLNTFFLLDDKLRMNSEYSVMPSSSKVSDSWFAIVNGANGIASKQELSAELLKAYDDAQTVLQDKDGNATPHYEAYMRYQDEYKTKIKIRNREYANAFTDPLRLQSWPMNGVTFQDDVDDAAKRWTGLGHKEEIERALNTLEARGTDPAIVLIARAKLKFANGLQNFNGIGNIPYTFLSPTTWYDPDNDDGWTDYSMRDFHSESHYESSSTAVSAGAGVNLGLWSGGGTFDHSDSHVNGSAQVRNLSIRFKYCAADIKRPWLDTSLLNLKNWFIVGDYKKGTVSSGKMAQELPASSTEPTFLPSLTTSLILVKDVRIKWDDWKSQWSEHVESNGGSASVGIYCFTAKASYSHAKTKRDFSCDDSGEELVIPGVQLIGYVSAINPLSPQLDSTEYMKK